jgi:hypothetical protein
MENLVNKNCSKNAHAICAKYIRRSRCVQAPAFGGGAASSFRIL